MVPEEIVKGQADNLHIPRPLFYRHPFKLRVVLLLHIEYEGLHIEYLKDFPGGSDGKESAAVQEMCIQSLDQEDPLEKGMATHSSILAWRIP